MGKTTHGFSGTRIYNIRKAMIQRCVDEKCGSYVYYGAKGISVCAEWSESFDVFNEWSMKNGYTEHMTIDRINSKGNYNPENCRWISMQEQILNQDRNSNRVIEDIYITKNDCGSFSVTISHKEKTAFIMDYRATFDTIEEARTARDLYVDTKEKTPTQSADKHEFGTMKDSDLSPEKLKTKKRKLKEELRKIKRLERDEEKNRIIESTKVEIELSLLREQEVVKMLNNIDFTNRLNELREEYYEIMQKCGLNRVFETSIKDYR